MTTINLPIVSAGKVIVVATPSDLPTGVSQGSVRYVASTSTLYTYNGSTWTTIPGGGGTASANTVYAGPSSGAAAIPTFRTLVLADIPAVALADFGDSNDGDVTISVNAFPTTDKYYSNLTINAGVNFDTGCVRVYVNGTATINGSYIRNGTAGGNASGATAGALAAGNSSRSFGGSSAGGVGATGVVGVGAAGTAGTTQTTGVAGGAAGGTGGAGTSGAGGAGGAGGTLTITTTPRYFSEHYLFGASLIGGGSGGGGGGSGAGDGSNTGRGGGGGGSGGGTVFLRARTLVIGAAGSISARGGNGGNGAAGAAGNTGGGAGGGGGGGGLIILQYGSLTDNSSGGITAAGGTGGTGGAGFGTGTAGANGSNGTAGLITKYNITTRVFE